MTDAPFVLAHIDRALEFHKASREWFIAIVDRLEVKGKLDSPLEAAFWIWWTQLQRLGEISNRFRLELKTDPMIPGRDYVLDFEIRTDRSLRFALEVDGYQYHERTLAQVEKRDRRDRDLQSAGWQVHHFSFHAFTKDPLESVREVADRAGKREVEIMRRELDLLLAKKGLD